METAPSVIMELSPTCGALKYKYLAKCFSIRVWSHACKITMQLPLALTEAATLRGANELFVSLLLLIMLGYVSNTVTSFSYPGFSTYPLTISPEKALAKVWMCFKPGPADLNVG